MDLVKPRLMLLIAFAIAANSVPAAPPQGCSTDPWEPYIAEASLRFDLPPEWLRVVMQAESAGCQFMNGAPTTSSAGAMGLMQLMPGTWNELRARHSLGSDPYDPHDHILASAAYLRELLDRYGTTGFLAAYHTGPARYRQHLIDGRSLPAATQDYLQRIHRELNWNSTLFVTRTVEQLPSHHHAKLSSTRSLFVTLRHKKSDAERELSAPGDVQPRGAP